MIKRDQKTFSQVEKVAAERPDEGRESARNASESPATFAAVERPSPPAPQGGGGIQYRGAAAEDASQLAKFARDRFVETFGHLYPPDDLASFVAEKYDPVLVRVDIEGGETHYHLALEGDEIVGYSKLGGAFDLPVEREPRAIELHRLYVHTRVKGQGVAQTLMDEALTWARAQGAAAMYLSVWENNFRAQAFYKRYGFEHIGEHGFMVGKTRDRDFIWRLVV